MAATTQAISIESVTKIFGAGRAHDLDVVGAKIKHGGGGFAGKPAAWCEAKMKNMRLCGTDPFINYVWHGSGWAISNIVRYIYDGNLVIQERDENNLPQVSYTRGTDLGGSLQGAGGIGGLLARTVNPLTLNPQLSMFATAVYQADGNGNITCLIYTNQIIAAKYEYDPYGNILSQSGSLAHANAYRFSSKEYHEASGYIYYLYRYYDSTLQRWLNRDPMQEKAGINLHEYVFNHPENSVDFFGLDPKLIGTIVDQVGPKHSIQTVGKKVRGVETGMVHYTPSGIQACYEARYYGDFEPVFTQDVYIEWGHYIFQDDDSLDADIFDTLGGWSDSSPPDLNVDLTFGGFVLGLLPGPGFDALGRLQRTYDAKTWTTPFQREERSFGSFNWRQVGNSYYSGSPRKISNCPCAFKVFQKPMADIIDSLNSQGMQFDSLTM